jgi:transposase
MACKRIRRTREEKLELGRRMAELVERGLTIKAAAKQLGVARMTATDALQDYREQAGIEETREKPEKAEPYRLGGSPADRKVVQLEEEVNRLRRALRAAHKDGTDLDTVLDSALRVSEYDPNPPRWLNTRPSNLSSPGIPTILCSDWHIGEVVSNSETGGLNEFNPEIAERRVRRLFENVVELCFQHVGGGRVSYPGIVVALGGDMFSGDVLHDELTETNARTAEECLFLTLDWLIAGIDLLLDSGFPRVFVPCVVGNHDRDAKKPRAKGRVRRSFGYMLYRALQRHYARLPEGHVYHGRVRVHIPDNTDALYSVYGHRYLLTHGDAMGVKGGDGIIGIVGPVTRGRIKIRDAEAQIGRDFDTLLMGHWHTYLPLRGAIVNGSIKGFDEYARTILRAKYEPPIQALWFTHPTYGITSQWPVYCDDGTSVRERREASEGQWLSVWTGNLGQEAA